MIVDVTGFIPEGKGEGAEANNRNLGMGLDYDQVTIGGSAELYGAGFTVDMKILNFGKAKTSFTIHNGGGMDAGPFVVEFYLSEDYWIDDLDTSLYRSGVPGLAAGDDYTNTYDLTVPTTDPFGGGTYKIGMVIDADDDVDEADETNNVEKTSVNYGRRIFFADFDHGDGAMEIDNDLAWAQNSGLWHITSHRSSPGGTRSMYYGREDVWDYDAGDTAGLFMTKIIELRNEAVAFTCSYWAQTDSRSDRDVFKVQVYDVAAGTYHDLLVKGTDLAHDTGGLWETATASLANYGYAGKQIRLRFIFDTIDAPGNAYEGVYFDDITVLAAYKYPVTAEAFRNLKYDSDLYYDAYLGWAGDHDALVFNEEQIGGTFTIRTDDRASAVNPAVAVYDYDTGEMLYIDDESGTGGQGRVLVDNSGRLRNSYMVEVWDTEEDSTGELDVLIDGSGDIGVTTITIDANGHGSLRNDISHDETHFYRATAPATASAVFNIYVQPTDGTMVPLLQVWKNDGDDRPELVTDSGRGSLTYVAPGDVFDISISCGDDFRTYFDLAVDFSPLPGRMFSAQAEGFAYFDHDGTVHDSLSIDARIQSAGDVASYVFTSEGAQLWGAYHISAAAPAGSSVSPAVAVYNGTSGARLGFASAAGGSTATLTLPAILFGSDQYVVAVADENSSETGDVEIVIDSPSSHSGVLIPLDAAGDGRPLFRGRIEAGETDFYRFVAPADTNGDLELRVVPAATLDSALALFDASGNMLGHAYRGGAGKEDTLSVSGLMPGETYYVSVMPTRHGSTGTFDLYVDFDLSLPGRMTSAEADGFAYFDHDGIVHDSLSIDARMQSAGDVASYVFASEGFGWGSYHITASAPAGSSVSPALAVYYGASGARVGFASAAGGSTATLDVSLWGGGRYVVAVADENSSEAGDVEIVIRSPYSHSGELIPLDRAGDGSSLGDTLEASDTGFYHFVAPANTRGYLDLRVVPAATLDSALAVFDASGNMLGHAYLAGAGSEDTLSVTGLMPGETYYVSVMSTRHASTGTFDLYVDLDLSLPDTMTWAQAEGFAYFDHDGFVHDSLSIDARIQSAGDVDSYVFMNHQDLLRVGLYGITAAAPAGSSVSPAVAVYNGASGVRMGFASAAGGSTATLDVSLWGGGRYVVAVADENTSETGDVEIRISSPFRRSGELIPLDAAGDGNSLGDTLEASDTDFYRFVAPANTLGDLELRVVPAATLDSALALFDASGNMLRHAYLAGAGKEDTLSVTGLVPGETYYVSVMSTRHASTGTFDLYVDFDPRFALSGTDLVVTGTSGRDTFHFAAGASRYAIRLNRDTRFFAAAAVSTVTFHPGQGTDTVLLTGGSGHDDVIFRANGTGQLTGVGYAVTFTQAEIQTFFGGADDRAYLYDGPNNDNLNARQTYSILSGPGYRLTVQNVDTMYAYGTGGGTNYATMYDGAENDNFTGREGYSHMRFQGGNGNWATGFDRVYAVAGAGTNYAILRDSAGDDYLVGGSTFAYLYGSGFYNHARGFTRVYGVASTGTDRAYLYGSDGSDTFVGASTFCYVRGPGFYDHARGFDYVYGKGPAGGVDTAFMYDGAGNDSFTARTGYADLSGPGFFYRAEGYERTYGYATAGGVDYAIFHDGAGNDVFLGRHNFSTLTLSTGNFYAATGFDKVLAYADAGGTDTATLFDDTTGATNDAFVGSPTFSYLTGQGYFNYASSFDGVWGQFSAGTDGATFYDSPGDDRFTGWGSYADIRDEAGTYYARAFQPDTVLAKGTAGGRNWLFQDAPLQYVLTREGTFLDAHLVDNFNDRDYDGWSVVSQTGATPNWSAARGLLTESGNVLGPTADATDHRQGTYAYYKGKTSGVCNADGLALPLLGGRQGQFC